MSRDDLPGSLAAFDHRPKTRIVFGPGSLERLGELARELGTRRALVVSDPGVGAAGHTGRGIDALRAAGLETALFDGVGENPTTRHVALGVEAARRHRPDLIVGLGGGSSMDCAKGVNFIHSCGGRMQDYRGLGRATGPLLPMIAVPTTAGTGSETQSFALISQDETHEKMACGDERAAFRIAVLDPQVTLSQTRAVTVATGIDALSHAVESFVTRARNLFSQALSLEAWRLLESSFERVLEVPDDLEARAHMQLGAAFAGLAIEHSMLGAAHSAANPLTAHYGVIHGQAVGVMLPWVVRFNSAVIGQDYAELARHARGCAEASPEALAHRLEELLGAGGLAASLRPWEIPAERIPDLAREAAGQWTAGFNPRPVAEGDFTDLYRRASA